MLAKGIHHTSPAGCEAGIQMAAAGFDDHIAALELWILMDPVPGMGELVAGTQAGKRCVPGMKVDGSVQQGQLFQSLADDGEQQFRFDRDCLADNPARDFDAQCQQVVGNGLVEFRDALLEFRQGLCQAQGLLAAHGLGLGLPGGKACGLSGGIPGLMPFSSRLFAYAADFVVVEGRRDRFCGTTRRLAGSLIEAGELPALPGGKR